MKTHKFKSNDNCVICNKPEIDHFWSCEKHNAMGNTGDCPECKKEDKKSK